MTDIPTQWEALHNESRQKQKELITLLSRTLSMSKDIREKAGAIMVKQLKTVLSFTTKAVADMEALVK